MSEPFSDKAQSSMDIALHKPRPAMPFIEDVDFSDVDIKSEIKSGIKAEIKAEPIGRESPLFEPESAKRGTDDEISVSDVKRLKTSTESGPLAYGGNPVRMYVPGSGKPYKYSRHEAIPELEMNSKHHTEATDHFLFCMKEVVLPALTPYKDEDKSVSDSVEWFKDNARIPAIPPTQFALIGNSGSGKTSTLNNLLGIPGLANADASMESVTQNPQIFNHGAQSAAFSVTVLFLHANVIMTLIKDSVANLAAYVKSLSDEDGEENEHVRASAESSKQVFDDLFSHQDGLKSLDDVEEFLETRNLLPQENGRISESAIQSLYQQIKDRASSDGIDLESESRKIHFTAGDIGELHAKTAIFSERGAFAPLVSNIRTKFQSVLLAMGIEIADLPGYTDTNMHLRKTSMAYSVNCPKAILVADLSRCLTTPELKKSLKDTIKHKHAENVCLVLRGKENVEKSRSKWTKDESAHLETLEKSLKTAKSQLDTHHESFGATDDVQKIERQILEYRIRVRDRVITDHFSQKEYQNKYNNGKIRIITVANKCQEQHMLGTNKAILSVDMAGIKDLRAFMCETPSKDRVRAFVRHSLNCIIRMRRISIWAEGPKMPPRDAAIALFEQHTRWGVDGYKAMLTKALTQYRKDLSTRFTSKWASDAQNAMDIWTTKYAAVSQGVFIRQGGRHSPRPKGMKTGKPKLVSWTEDLLTPVEDDVLDLLKSVFDLISDLEGRISENITDVGEKIRHGLDMLDTIGGANLEGVFELFKEEGKACTSDIKDGMRELETNLRSTALKYITDEPCDDDSPAFVREMVKIFAATWKKFPPKTKNATKERMKYIREQVISPKGPYNSMSTEIAAQLAQVINEWAKKTDARIAKMHQDLRDVLFKSFEGKKMPDARRQEIAPAIKLAMIKARAVLQADLEGYGADVLL